MALIVGPLAVAGSARGDDPRDAQIADLQRRLDELSATVRQMQDTAPSPASLAAPPAGWTSQSVQPGDNAQSPPQGETFTSLQPSGTSAQQNGTDPPSYPTSIGLPTGVTSSVPPRPTERQNIHTGGFPLAGWNDGFYLRSDDGSYELHITGQLQVDYREYPEDIDTGTSPDTILIRKARLGIEATVLQYYEVRLLPDFAQSSISKSITDAYLNFHYWDAFQMEAGKFKQPFSYEQLIQDRYTPLMERSLIDQETPQRDEGLMIHGRKLFGDRFDYAFAISNGDQNDTGVDSNNAKDFNTRMVVRPFDKDDEWLHGVQFGCSYGVGIEGAPYGTNNVAPNPSTLVTPAQFEWFAFSTTTGSAALQAGERTRVSPELEYFHGPLGFATQYFEMNQQFQLSTAHSHAVTVPFNGFYIMGSYLLTGETRYDYTEQIDPINPFLPYAPVASPGAWELLFRVSRLDLGPQVFTDHLVSPTGEYSREATETTLGANWYLNKWVRTQFNWEHAWFAEPVEVGNEPHPLHHEDCLYCRFQIIF